MNRYSITMISAAIALITLCPVLNTANAASNDAALIAAALKTAKPASKPPVNGNTYTIEANSCKYYPQVGPTAFGWGVAYINIKSSNCRDRYGRDIVAYNYDVVATQDSNGVAHFYNINGKIAGK
ncbi:MAG: hypothetical protein V4525_01205 [Pseudomonadota bacterium]